MTIASQRSSVKKWIRVNLLQAKMLFRLTLNKEWSIRTRESSESLCQWKQCKWDTMRLERSGYSSDEAIDGIFIEQLLHYTVKTQPTPSIITSNHHAFQQGNSLRVKLAPFNKDNSFRVKFVTMQINLVTSVWPSKESSYFTVGAN